MNKEGDLARQLARDERKLDEVEAKIRKLLHTYNAYLVGDRLNEVYVGCGLARERMIG